MRTALAVVVLALVGCGDDPDTADDAADESSSSSSSTSTSTTTVGTTVAPTTTTDATESSGGASETSADSSGATTETTAPPGDCDFPSAVDELFAEAKVPPIDCGSLTLNDDLAAWEAARLCARDAALDHVAYRVLWQHDDGSGLRDSAIAAVVGEAYQVYWFDDDAAVGTTSISQITCTGIAAPDACTVEVGQPCLDCTDPSEPAELCD